MRTSVCTAVFAAAWATAVASVCLSGPVPGTYKMEWLVPEYEMPLNSAFCELKAISAGEARRFQGLASAAAFEGHAGTYTIVVDESGGTGSGYDVVYVIEGVPSYARVDLAGATRIPLAPEMQGGEQVLLPPDESRPIMVDIEMGSEGSRVTKQAALEVGVLAGEVDDGRLQPGWAAVMLRGGWYGFMRTDAGVARVMTLDGNSNGLYSDPRSSGNESPDGVILLRASRYQDEPVYLGHPGNVLSLDGEYCLLTISPTGEEFSIKPYEGGLGTVRIAVPEAGDKQVLESVQVGGPMGDYRFTGASAGEFQVPAGHYDRLYASLNLEPDAGPDFGLRADINRETPFEVTRDSVLPIKLDGPMKVEINQGADSVAAKPGGYAQISLSFSLGENDVTLSSARSAVVNIRDPRGKLLISTKAPFG